MKHSKTQHKEMKSKVDTLEKQLDLLTIEHEKLLVEYGQLYGGYVILQRNLKLLCLNSEHNVFYPCNLLTHYPTERLDNLELVVTENEGFLEFKVVGELNENKNP